MKVADKSVINHFMKRIFVRLKHVTLFVISLISIGAGDAASANAVTYDFTGTVTSASGIYSSVAVGTLITGTYTFDYANAQADEGAIGGDGAFDYYEISGSSQTPNYPLSNPSVFYSTARVAGFTYQTALGSYDSGSTITNANGGPFTFEASESQVNADATGGASGINIYSGNVPQAAVYDSNGLPVLNAGASNNENFQTNQFSATGSGEVTYSLTSLTPATVPLPGAALLLLSGLGGLGTFARKQRRRL